MQRVILRVAFVVAVGAAVVLFASGTSVGVCSS